MHSFNTSKIVPYTCEEMYTLVNDIENYSLFLPWCQDSIIHESSEDEIKATLIVFAKGFTQSLTTHNRMQKNKKIEMHLIDGPLKHLESSWRFEKIAEPENILAPQCHVFFEIEFEFSNRLIRMALEPLFDMISNTIVNAFVERAKVLYPRDNQ
jgi:ribosome-associated toxin RatA of RatAB toxin-antitoxin module